MLYDQVHIYIYIRYIITITLGDPTHTLGRKCSDFLYDGHVVQCMQSLSESSTRTKSILQDNMPQKEATKTQRALLAVQFSCNVVFF